MFHNRLPFNIWKKKFETLCRNANLVAGPLEAGLKLMHAAGASPAEAFKYTAFLNKEVDILSNFDPANPPYDERLPIKKEARVVKINTGYGDLCGDGTMGTIKGGKILDEQMRAYFVLFDGYDKLCVVTSKCLREIPKDND